MVIRRPHRDRKRNKTTMMEMMQKRMGPGTAGGMPSMTTGGAPGGGPGGAPGGPPGGGGGGGQ